MTDLGICEQFRQHLITNSVARSDMNTAGALPPVILNPVEGPPQPDFKGALKADQAFITIRLTGTAPTDHLEGFLEEPIVEVIVRAKSWPTGEMLQRVIRGLVNDRKDFMLGSLHVQWCLLWRGVQPVPLTSGAVSETFDLTQSFRFQVRVAELTV